MSKSTTNVISKSVEKISLDDLSTNGDGIIDMFSKLKDEEIIRGTKPEGLEKKCLQLCQSFIGGSWLQTNETGNIIVTRITGGLTNQLYRVQLKDTVNRVLNSIYPIEPTEVAIKFYMPKHMKSYNEEDGERLNDIIILTILSQVGIGPKVYGIFSEGVIQEFVDHDQFTVKYQKRPEKLREVVSGIARVHHLNVPIRKTNNWMLDETIAGLKVAYSECNAQALIDEVGAANIQNNDPRIEYEKMVKYVENLKAPIVFCHNDFRGSNILVRKSDEKVLFVDLEYSAFGPRGSDLATYINEWGFEPFEFEKQGLPDDDVLEMFAQMYIDECNKIVPGYADRPENTVVALVKEIKVLNMLLYLFFLSFMMKSKDNLVDAIPFDPKANMKFSDYIYKRYLDTKQRCIADGIIVD